MKTQFKIVVSRPGKTTMSYVKNNHRLIGELLPRFRDQDHEDIKSFVAGELGDSLSLKDRSGQAITITRTR
jgi:hypothetical protein